MPAREPDRKLRSHSADETRACSRTLAPRLGPGAVVLLFGGLGAGKTCLVQGIAEGLGIDPRQVHSPSFIMVNRHDGRYPLHHVDLYRLKEGESFEDLGLEELFGSEGVTVVEWAERLPDAARPRERVDIHISHLDESTRLIEMRDVSEARPGL